MRSWHKVVSLNIYGGLKDMQKNAWLTHFQRVDPFNVLVYIQISCPMASDDEYVIATTRVSCMTHGSFVTPPFIS